MPIPLARQRFPGNSVLPPAERDVLSYLQAREPQVVDRFRPAKPQRPAQRAVTELAGKRFTPMPNGRRTFQGATRPRLARGQSVYIGRFESRPNFASAS